MNWTDLNLIPAMPEIVLLTALCAVLLVDLWLPDEKRGITAGLAILGVLAAAVFQVALWPGEPVETFNAMFVLDGMSYVAKLAVYAVVLVLFVVSRGYLKARQIYKGEFYSLTMFALLGMCVMVSANHFLTLYIGLELLSLSLYALIALRREDTRASEAALKYFVLGALASGLLLYGISMIYGATGSLLLPEVLMAGLGQPANPWLLKPGLVFVVVAVAFKLGAVPFAAKLDFSGKDTKLDIASPAALGLKFGAQNEINLPGVKSLLPYSPLLKSLQISEGGVNIKTKDFENLSIEANDVKFETPLFKKDGSPYGADSFVIDVNAKGATGKSKSGGLNFKISGGKTELFIKELDLVLSGGENLSEKDGDIEFEAKGSKLILNDFNATLDLLAYSGQSTGGTVRFDAKPARGNFSLIKSDKKFEMSANDIRGEFINSIFNIKSFEGGSFKMRVLGGSTDDFKGEVRLIGATLKDYTFYNQLLTFLNSVPSLLVFKTPDFGADGYPVKFGKILFEKKGEILKFLAIELESSSADIGGHGTINLATKEIDVDLELKLLKDASSIIDKIPLINQIVLGKDRTLSTVIKVRGTLQKPQYSTQILKDALLSPFKIIRNVLEAPFLIFE